MTSPCNLSYHIAKAEDERSMKSRVGSVKTLHKSVKAVAVASHHSVKVDDERSVKSPAVSVKSSRQIAKEAVEDEKPVKSVVLKGSSAKADDEASVKLAAGISSNQNKRARRIRQPATFCHGGNAGGEVSVKSVDDVKEEKV